MMPISFFTDFTSPFAYLTLRYLTKIKDLYLPDIEITPLSFPFSSDKPKTFKELLQKHLGFNDEDFNEYFEDLKLIFLGEGIVLNEQILISDYTLAHYALKFANNYHLGANFSLLIYEAIFVKGLDVSEEEIIYNIIEDLQLDLNLFKRNLEEEIFLPAIKQDHLLCKTLEISVVPYMIVENQISIKQYYDYDSLLTVLLKVKDHLDL